MKNQCIKLMWPLSLPLMKSFNKTEAAVFPMQAMLPEDFPLFSQIILKLLNHHVVYDDETAYVRPCYANFFGEKLCVS